MITVLDTETTGMDPSVDQVCELAQVHLGGTPEDDTWHDNLCGISVPMSLGARVVHHIDPSDLKGRPPLLQRLSQTWQSSTRYVVAHNAAFDAAFIVPALQQLEPPQEPIWICTMRCAKHIWPDAPGYSNQMLRYWLGLTVDLPDGLYPHQALYDALVTTALLRRQLSERPVEDLARMSTEPALLTRVPRRLKAHAGKLWYEVPEGYCRWLLRANKEAEVRLAQGGADERFDPDVVHTAMHRLGLV